MACILIHGVPDTPTLWEALIKQLDLDKAQIITPALPGFTAPVPKGFSSTKEAYVEWLIDRLETEFKTSGPVDLVGHDWGALLVMRVAYLRPDLIKSWVAMSAVVLTGAGWHRIARLFQMPVIGEILMLCARPWVLRKNLTRVGMPTELANQEACHINRHMKRSILRLYRSAVDVNNEWGRDFNKLPKRGLVVCADQDRFMPLKKIRRFGETYDVPVCVAKGGGHWMLWENPQQIAQILNTHWQQN